MSLRRITRLLHRIRLDASIQAAAACRSVGGLGRMADAKVSQAQRRSCTQKIGDGVFPPRWSRAHTDL